MSKDDVTPLGPAATWYRHLLRHGYAGSMLSLLVVSLALSSFVSPFLFNITSGNLAECGDLAVSWTGGQPPFNLLIVPPGSTSFNISIPDSAFDGQKGNFTTQLRVTKGREIFLSMSDATSLVAGGTSELKTVGDAISGKTCNATDLEPDFFFSLDSDLQQCKPYPFTLFDGAILPLTIIYYIPGGSDSFVLRSPSTGDSFVWTANVTAGTTMVFSVRDSHGRNGGNSGKKAVILTDDTSCLSTRNSTLTPGKNASARVHLSAGAAAGIAVGAMALFILQVCLVVWFWRRWRRTKSQRQSIPKNPLDLDSDPAEIQDQNSVLPADYTLTPFTFPPSMAQVSPSHPDSGLQTPVRSIHHPSRSTSSKHRYTVSNPDVLSRPVTIVEHTDLDDLPVEIPPRYSDRRSSTAVNTYSEGPQSDSTEPLD